ncbi:retrograde regulation protein 2 [Polychaeton citri CBS 116435]|uniref:Retrograde regulation protein 2 n=1 Tax=Polychaeton citri CBS 116435 TaxID=1314669 RepID=A0A9P4UKS9_9PEZI|nr:retrograde regulation protein 2 [Polychaeton citri CBS 116435]
MTSHRFQDEKLDLDAAIEHFETVEKQTSGVDASDLPAYDDKEAKRILRKVDYRLVPMLTLLYLLAFLDRGNIGNAKVAGMNDDLGLTGTQYNIALTVFFFPYALFEVPSNVVLKLIRPSLWISIMMVSWGLVMTFQGLVQGYHGLIVTRTLLGLTESGFFPAATYLLTCWYCRFEVQTRLAVFFSAASLAGAFSGLLAFAIAKMNGVGGLEGWRWIFILEGILTVLIGFSLYWTLPDSPETASFLKPYEREYIIRRLCQDSGTRAGKVSTNEPFKWSYLRSALFEWKIWLAVIVYWGNSISLYGFTYSAPSIILGLGYSSAMAQILTIPVYFVGVCGTVLFSWLADKRQKRWPFIVGPYAIAAACFVALLAIPHPRYPGLTYAFLFGIPAGVYPPLIGILSFIGNNLAPSWKRSIGMALLISMGNLGGAIGSNIYLESQSPAYPLGYGLSLGIVLAAIFSTMVLRLAYGRQNEKRDRKDEGEVRAHYSEDQLLELGDKSPLYRYVI